MIIFLIAVPLRLVVLFLLLLLNMKVRGRRAPCSAVSSARWPAAPHLPEMAIKAAALPSSACRRHPWAACTAFGASDRDRSATAKVRRAIQTTAQANDNPGTIASSVIAAGSLFMQPTQANVHHNPDVSSVRS